MIKQGRFPIIGSGNNRRSMAYIDNLVQGLLLAATKEEAIGEVFWIADDLPYSMNDIVGTVSSVLKDDFNISVKPNNLRLPSFFGDFATLADATLQSFGVYNQKIHVLSELNKTIACDIGKAKDILSYSPIYSLRDGMRESIKWCLENNIRI